MSGRLVLLRHGQSVANVDKRLDTRPPGADLTPLGREQARAFAQAATSQPGLLLHSVATRAVQTAAEISAVVDVPAREVTGIHEVQVGDLEGRSDDDAVAQFNAVYERWLKGERDVSMPGGENGNQVLDRYLPVLTELRTRYLDKDDWASDIVVVSHGAAIRLTAAILAEVESSFALDHHLANTEAVVLTATADGRWECVQWGTLTPPFYPIPDADPVADAAESSSDPMG
jgi:broad specificity phosphatase PhoE